MITVGFSTRKDNQEFISYLKLTSGVNIEVIQKINNGEYKIVEYSKKIFEIDKSKEGNHVTISEENNAYIEFEKLKLD